MKLFLLASHWALMHISNLWNRWLERRGNLVRSIDAHSTFLHHRKRVYGLDSLFLSSSRARGG